MGEVIKLVHGTKAKSDPKLWVGGDSPIDDQTPYRDPPLEEYLASAGYETSTDTSACKLAQSWRDDGEGNCA